MSTSLGPLVKICTWNEGWSWPRAVTFAVVTLGVAFQVQRYRSSRARLALKNVIAITGCDSGLGYSLAVHCRELGATVVASVLQVDGEAALDLTSRGVFVLPLNLTDSGSVRAFVEALEGILEDRQLELRALVNNAGVMIFGEFEWQLEEQTRSQMEVNVLGPMSLTRQLMPIIRGHGARIVNVTSHCAIAPLPGLAVYGASKAALQAWTTSLRVELGKYGLRVVSFIPGSFTTESNLMARQKCHFDAMRIGMKEETKQFYGDYFETYVGYLTGLSIDKGLCRLGNLKVYETFDGALLDEYPSAVYKCEPWRYTFYHALFRITPTRARDWLVERFMQMPSWCPKSRST